CGVYRNRLIDRGISLGLFFLYSIPPFVAGMLFLVVLCYHDTETRWFPMVGLHSQGWEDFSAIHKVLDFLWHACLPVLCLALYSPAAMAMYSRATMLDVLNHDYIRTDGAKGVSGPLVILKHGLRNGLIPILTLFANSLPAMLGGSILIE